MVLGSYKAFHLGRWKHPNIVRARIERTYAPALARCPFAT